MSATNMQINPITSFFVDKFLSLFVICMIVIAAGCVSSFEPEYHSTDEILIVDGSFIKGQEKQVIQISKTSPISQPEYKPVENCEVKVTDDSGNEFAFSEESPGKYVATINDELIQYGALYKLAFSTPDGNLYESGYQRMLPTEPVDSIYGLKEDRYSSESKTESVHGMQFYIDLDVSGNASKYYRWQLEETCEFNAKEDIWGVYDGNTIKTENLENIKTCWRSNQIDGLYSASTAGLSANRIRKIPLYYKFADSEELKIKYCLTVSQYALNEDAYKYWDQKRVELYESGGIYTRQPDQPRSNISNISKPDERVLGFFWASSCRKKRLFLTNPFRKEPVYGYNCNYYAVFSNTGNLSELKEILLTQIQFFHNELPDPPIYILKERDTYYLVATPICADCRKTLNGSSMMPDFWE